MAMSTPPPIPGSSPKGGQPYRIVDSITGDIRWTSPLIILVIGFMYCGYLFQTMAGLLNFEPTLHPEVYHLGPHWGRYYHFYFLTLVPLGFLIDRYLRKIDAVIAGVSISAFGFLCMLVGVEVTVYFAIVLILLGTGLTVISLLAYAGNGIPGKRKNRLAGYLYCIMGFLIGTQLSDMFIDSRMSASAGVGFVISSLLISLLIVTTLAFVRRKNLVPYPMPQGWVPWGSIGYTSIGFYALLSSILMVNMGRVRLFGMTEHETLAFSGVILLVAACTLLFASSDLKPTGKLRLALLLGSAYSLTFIDADSAGVSQYGFILFDFKGDHPLSPQTIHIIMDVVALGGLATLIATRQKIKHLSIKLLALIALLTLFMVMMPIWQQKLGMPEGMRRVGWLFFSGFYVLLISLATGFLYFLIWEAAPLRYRTMCFALVFLGEYMGERYRAWEFDQMDYLSAIVPSYLGNGPIIWVVGAACVGGLIYLEIKARQKLKA